MNNKKWDKRNPHSWERPSKIRQAPPAQTRPHLSPKPDVKEDVNISISLSLPAGLVNKFKGAKKAIGTFRPPHPSAVVRHRLFKRTVLVMAGAVFVLVAWQFLNKPERPQGSAGVVQGVESTTPDFEPLRPIDKKDIERKYDSKHKIISFQDQLVGLEIVVSQQKLPETFKADPQGSLENFAKKINATTPVDAGDVKAFAGKSVNGPQTIVFQKNELLIFIYSPKELDKNIVGSYIKILE